MDTHTAPIPINPPRVEGTTRIYAHSRAERHERKFIANALTVSDKFMAGQVRYFYRQARRHGLDRTVARSVVWNSVWLGSLHPRVIAFVPYHTFTPVLVEAVTA